MNSREKLIRIRGELIDLICQFFNSRGFLRVETPSIYLSEESNPHIKSIKVGLEFNGKRIDATLITSPEIFMKRLLADGFGNIYQMCRFYRNDEYGNLHSPEFLGLEFYELNKNYYGTMDTTEELIKFLIREKSLRVFNRYGKEIDFTKPFARISVMELLKEYGVYLNSLEDIEELKSELKDRINITDSDSYDDIFFKFFLTYIEPELGKVEPIFLFDYPPSMSSMAKISEKGGIRVAERYELYFNQVEICNGFSELNDADEQAERLIKDLNLKGAKNNYDRVFIEALKRLPQCSGNAIGIDRLIMVLLNLKSIKDIILFPLDEEIELYKK
ncbi:MAG: amino acid--tRNA ligase-related protein [Myxococcota bacterium]